MDVATARWLVSAAAQPWLTLAAAEADPAALAAAARFRRDLAPEQAAAVLSQITLRRRARAKLGSLADSFFLTRDGLEQATRPDVANWRADRLRRAGVTGLTDAAAGLGFDAVAAVAAGIAVRAVERDPVTAVFLAANLAQASAAQPGLAGRHEVLAGAAEDLVDPRRDAADLPQAIFVDPSRRTAQGRSWRLDDLSPAWAWLEQVFSASRGPVVVKLGPGAPRSQIPASAEAIWVSQAGDLVELSLWLWPGQPSPGPVSGVIAAAIPAPTAALAQPAATPGRLSAISAQPADVPIRLSAVSVRPAAAPAQLAAVPDRPAAALTQPVAVPDQPAAALDQAATPPAKLPPAAVVTAAALPVQLTGGPALSAAVGTPGWSALILPAGCRLARGAPPPLPGPLAAYLWEPDPAVIRADAVGALARLLGARPLADQIAYLTGGRAALTPYATAFEVLGRLPFSDKAVRAWIRQQGIAALEVKTRGLGLDPAVWRRRLGLGGGRAQATVVCAPTVDGAAVIIVRRRKDLAARPPEPLPV
ncbi:MAG: class I SAM-dependent methyltransferase [Propionibacteriaceae bacterium]|jgi:hypothetical protein|nr:class I SAM-dependent methyltransferase [Propionibacteriaceae bacterium]